MEDRPTFADALASASLNNAAPFRDIGERVLGHQQCVVVVNALI